MKTQLIVALALLCVFPAWQTQTAEADTTKKTTVPPGIENLGKGKYRISQTEFYRLLGSMAFLSQQARLRPVIRNKLVAGYQIYKIRKDSIFTKLGLKDRDRLERINGIPLDGPRRKNQLLAQAQKADKIELVLRRKGKRITLVYLLGPAQKAAVKPKPQEPRSGNKQDHP